MTAPTQDTTQPGITHEEMVALIESLRGEMEQEDNATLEAILASLIRLREIEGKAARYDWLKTRAYVDGGILSLEVANIDNIAIGSFDTFIDAHIDALLLRGEAVSKDYAAIVKSVADTIAKGGKPLTEAQYMLLTGSLAVWLDKCLHEYGQAVRDRDAEIAEKSTAHVQFQSQDCYKLASYLNAAIAKEPLP